MTGRDSSAAAFCRQLAARSTEESRCLNRSFLLRRFQKWLSGRFVHISAVEKAGYAGLAEGAKVSYELVTGRFGKVSAENLRIG
jgi:hypothetical protein